MMLNPKPAAGDLRPKSLAFLLQGRPAMSVSLRLPVLTLIAVFATPAGAAADDTDALFQRADSDRTLRRR
jgi:hypothetical protein